MASRKALRKMGRRRGRVGRQYAASSNGNGRISEEAKHLLENAALRGASGSNNVTKLRQVAAAKKKSASRSS